MAFVITSGHEGLAVLKVQQYLNHLTTMYQSMSVIKEDGMFGEATKTAVAAFQKETGLPANGVVCTMTWDKLIAKYKGITPTPPTPTPIVTKVAPLQYGSVGLEVEKMQGYLNKLVVTSPLLIIDGHFGTKTEAKVIQYQMKNALTADGKIGDITWTKIIDMI